MDLQSLERKSKEEQIEIMRDWFFENYEDPANCCPYESREGGYFYLWGGPYDANEELQTMFADHVEADYIQELVDELQQNCWDWSGRSDKDDSWYEHDVYNAVISSQNPFNKFLKNINNIKLLSKNKNEDKLEKHLFGILYTNVITVLETLYVELFINSIEKDDSYIISCIEKGKTQFKVNTEIVTLPFKGQSIEKIREELIKAVKEHLVSASWHDTDLVIKRYKATFCISVQKSWPIDQIQSATIIRNHLVHRGGKDKAGKEVVIKKENLDQLLDDAESLGQLLYESLDNALNKKTHEKIKVMLSKARSCW